MSSLTTRTLLRTRAVDRLPDLASLPTLGDVISAHEELTISTRVDNEIQSGRVPLMALTTDRDSADAQELLRCLKSIDVLFRVRSQSEWFNAFVTVTLRHINAGSPLAGEVLSLIKEWVALGKKGQDFVARRVDVGDAHPNDEELTAAIDALCSGKNPYGFISIGKSNLKAKVAQILIEGRAPQSKEDWMIVKNCRSWLAEIDGYLVSWRASAAEAKLPPHHDFSSKAAPFMVLKIDEMAVSYKVFANINRNREVSKRLAPYGFDWTEVFDKGTTKKFAHALAVNLARHRKDGSAQFLERLRGLVRDPSLPFDAELKTTISRLGDTEVSSHEMARIWQITLDEAARLNTVRSALEEADALTAKIAEAGAPEWAKLLRTLPIDSESFQLLPINWRDAWDWAKADGFIKRISDRERVASLTSEQTKLETDQKRLFAEVVRLRTFLGLKIKITDLIEAAINKFAAAIARPQTTKLNEPIDRPQPMIGRNVPFERELIEQRSRTSKIFLNSRRPALFLGGVTSPPKCAALDRYAATLR